MGLLDKFQIDDICFPKDKEKLNPKQNIVGKILDTLKKPIDLNLPELSIPAASQIDLKDKMFGQLDQDPELDEKVELEGLDPPEKERKLQEFKDKLRIANTVGAEKLKNPQVLGVVAALATGTSVNFFNPFVCAPSGDGATIPPVPAEVFGGIATLAATIPAAIDLLTAKDMEGKNLRDILRNTVNKTIPSLRVPDPSNLSIKDFAINTSSKLALFAKPSLPNPGPPVFEICIPGNLIRATLLGSISLAITGGAIEKLLLGGAPADDQEIAQTLQEIVEECRQNADPSVSFPGTANGSIPIGVKELKMRDLNPSDIRQLLTDLIQGSLGAVEKVLGPVLTSIAVLQAFPELDFFKLPVVEVNKGFTLIFEEQQLDLAFDQLNALSAIPFIVVATGGEASRALHPLANQDNLPPWERLSLSNPLFVVFLDQFCSTARSGGGFKEGTLFPAPG